MAKAAEKPQSPHILWFAVWPTQLVELGISNYRLYVSHDNLTIAAAISYLYSNIQRAGVFAVHIFLQQNSTPTFVLAESLPQITI